MANHNLYTKAMITASGNYLTENFPDDYQDWEDESLLQFMEDHAWQPLEDMPVEWVYEQIEICASLLVRFCEDNQKN